MFKWIAKNKIVTALILFVTLIVYLRGQFRFRVIESFEITDIKVKNINNALDSIIACEKTNNCEGDNIISDFAQFKKELKYPKFSVVLFNELLNKRKAKEEHLTNEEFVFIVKEGKFESSFK